MDVDDPIVSIIPIQLSSALDPHLHLFQYPLLSRPLSVPPSALNAGKNITARSKPKSDRIEIHVPFDTRQEVWNQRRGLEYGAARREEDGKKPSPREEYRLEELRLRSQRVPHTGMYMVGVLRGNRLHLHPVSATYKLRPHLGYIDVLSQKTRRKPTEEEENAPSEIEEEDVDDSPKVKKSKKDVKEIHVHARKTDGTVSSSMSDMRREMLKVFAAEDSEEWIPIKYCDEDDSTRLLEGILAPSDTHLQCTSTMASIL